MASTHVIGADTSEQEIWAAVPGYEGYRASTLGKIQTLWRMERRGRKNGGEWIRLVNWEPVKLKVIGGCSNTAGYVRANMKGGARLVHQIVLETFVSPRPGGLGCRHLNDDKSDNRLVNLVWGTQADNIQDALRNRRIPHGLDRKGTKLSDEQVREARQLRAEGWLLRSLSARYGMGVSQMSMIVRDKARRL